GLGNILGQFQVVVLHFFVGGVGPDQLSVLEPRFMHGARLNRQVAMIFGDVVVAEECLTGDGMHFHGMEEAYEFRKIADWVILVLTLQWMAERNVDSAVRVLDIKDYGVAPGFMPTPNQFNAFGATGRRASQVNGANLAIFGKRPAFFHNR